MVVKQLAVAYTLSCMYSHPTSNTKFVQKFQLLCMLSGMEMDQTYSDKPEACMGHGSAENPIKLYHIDCMVIRQ